MQWCPTCLWTSTDELDTIVAMLACHGSQVFEWLPFNQGVLDQVPEDEAGRLDWVRRMYADYARSPGRPLPAGAGRRVRRRRRTDRVRRGVRDQ